MGAKLGPVCRVCRVFRVLRRISWRIIRPERAPMRTTLNSLVCGHPPQVTAGAGCVTHVHDVDRGRVEAAVASLRRVTDKLVEKGKMTNEARSELLGALVVATDIELASRDIDLVIEAVPEQLDLKVSVLGRVKAAAPPHAIMTSNTSSLSITELGTRPEDDAPLLRR